MSVVLTNFDLVQRVRDLAHEQVNTGPYDTGFILRNLEYALEQVYEWETSRRLEWGLADETWTTSASEPNGRVPGLSIPLPSDFLRLHRLYKQDFPMQRGSSDRREQRLELSDTGGNYGYYWIDGPSQTVGTSFGETAARLTVTPELREGDEMSWIYVRTPPKLIDPSDPDPSNPTVPVSLDLLEFSVVQAVCAVAAAKSSARGDMAALRVALQTEEQELRRRVASTGRLADLKPLRTYRRSYNRRFRVYR